MLSPSEPKPSGSDDDVGSGTLAAIEWTADDREDNWLISYADLLSVIFTMVVLLFGRMTVVAETPAVEAAAAEPKEQVVAAPTPTTDEVAAAAKAEPVASAEPRVEPVPAVAASLEGPPAPAPLEGPPAPASAPDSEALLARADDDVAAPADSATNEPAPPLVAPSREDRVADLIEQRFRGQIAATRREHGLEITIPEVALFASARAALQESARPVLAELAATLREGGAARISVEGHTDNVPVQGGQFASNWDLASARANAVARYLLEQGFAPSRLQSVSYADTRPVASNDSVEGRAANRRVELQIGFIDENGSGAAPESVTLH
jgi:chemotaxis protein MotB